MMLRGRHIAREASDSEAVNDEDGGGESEDECEVQVQYAANDGRQQLDALQGRIKARARATGRSHSAASSSCAPSAEAPARAAAPLTRKSSRCRA